MTQPNQGRFRVDITLWPLVVHTVEGNLSDDQLDQYVTAGTEVLMRGEPHAVILDISAMGRFSAYARARSSQWQLQYRDQLRQYCVGTAYVVPNPWLRFIVMTVLLVGKLPTPYTVCDSLEHATTWCRERLAQHQGRSTDAQL